MVLIKANEHLKCFHTFSEIQETVMKFVIYIYSVVHQLTKIYNKTVFTGIKSTEGSKTDYDSTGDDST